MGFLREKYGFCVQIREGIMNFYEDFFVSLWYG